MQDKQERDGGRQRVRKPRRGLIGGTMHAAGIVLPGALLVLMPKCPACFAGYIALATGFGISVPAASGIRLALATVFVCSILFFAVYHLRRHLGSRKVRDAAAVR